MTHLDEAQYVLVPPADAAIFLVVTVRPGAEDGVHGFLSGVSGLLRAVGFRAPEGQLNCVVGIGARLWDRLYGSPRPAGLHPFLPIAGAVHSAPATPGDLLFHVRARRMDLCFALASQLVKGLAGHADVADEVHGFRYFDERDLLGFVDGTENPSGAAAVDAVRISDDDPAFAGGSYVIVQKYLHDLDAWNALTVEEQDRAFGRHKLDDIEIPDALKAANSHVALNTIVDANGTQRQIVRDNMPFGRIGSGEFGTYFIGYASNPDVIEEMLRNMFVGKPPGNHDRILDFSVPVTGGLFFVPTADFLDNQPAYHAVAHGAAVAVTASGEPAHPDSSLGVGSLRRTRSGSP